MLNRPLFTGLSGESRGLGDTKSYGSSSSLALGKGGFDPRSIKPRLVRPIDRKHVELEGQRASLQWFELTRPLSVPARGESNSSAIRYFSPITIESGPTRCSARVLLKPASVNHPMQSVAV